MNIKLAAVGFVLVTSMTAFADAHSIAVRLGRIAPRIESDLWDDNVATFAIERSDLDALIGGAELSLALTEIVDVGFGVETSSTTVFSNYRDFVFEDGSEILQDLTLRTTPLTVGVRVLPLGKEHRVAPYVTGGAAFYVYEYREEGEFVDFATFDIAPDLFLDRGLAYGGYLGAGVEMGLTETVAALAEYRRHWGRGTHGGDFLGFGRFDLTANQVSFGLAFRF